MIDVPSHAQPFLAARDLLLRHRTDRDAAVAQFRWPQLERFNWALDWFDPMARGNAAPALWIVGEDGARAALQLRPNVATDPMRWPTACAASASSAATACC